MGMFVCSGKTVRSFLSEQLEEDDRLAFLFHLDECPNCWEAVYNGTKANHPHFYKQPPKKAKFSESELNKLEFGKEEKEEVFEVA